MRIEVKDLAFTYSPGTPFAKRALDGIDLSIEEGDFVGILGHTGSGKSTFILHLNGLIKLQSGSIDVFDIKLVPDKKNKQDLRKLRGTVGMVFQYPEYQLFEDTVEKDVAFGPKNLGLSQEEVDRRVERAIRLVGLDFEDIRGRAPFELSGGQKRRVAIAGIIAMQPRVLVLDEPTAMLDPVGRREVISTVERLCRERGMTVVLITHHMSECVQADRLIALSDGRMIADGTPREVFAQIALLRQEGLTAPATVRLLYTLRQAGFDVPLTALTVDECADAVAALLAGKGAR